MNTTNTLTRSSMAFQIKMNQIGDNQMIPKANTSNPASASQQPVSSQPSVNQNNSIPTAVPVTAQPTRWNPFSACFAAKNSVENVQSNTAASCTPLTRGEKAGFGVYFCTYASVGIPTALAAAPALGVVGGMLVGASLGASVGLPSGYATKQIVTRQEQAEAKKQD